LFQGCCATPNPGALTVAPIGFGRGLRHGATSFCLQHLRLLAFILPGGLVTSSYVWAIYGLPADLSLEQAIASIALFYVVGRMVQSVGSILEDKVFSRAFGSSTDHKPPSPISHLVDGQVEATFPSPVARLEIHDRIQFVRSYLRLAKFSDRAELLNELHFLFRGLAASGVLAFPAFLVSALCGRNHTTFNEIASALAGGGAIISYLRYRKFGSRFARQVWIDFLVVTAAKRPG
jgi:hypothetical protein